MEASSLSAAGAPSTPLWTVGYTDWLGCKLWTGERNRTLLRGLCLHPTALACPLLTFTHRTLSLSNGLQQAVVAVR